MARADSHLPRRILLSGASGLIGSRLFSFLLERGEKVVRLVRSPHPSTLGTVSWDPERGAFCTADFEGFDAVIHLAGANLASKRWTSKRKAVLFSSRCRDTWVLAQILSRLTRPPDTVITASAIGYYGNRGTEALTEQSPPGTGFLADLCVHWERATEILTQKGIRVIHPRLGVVLSPEGGMLRALLPLFRLGLGGRVGSGNQILSWIALEDVLNALTHVLRDKAIQGPVNFVAPESVPQKVFAQMLGRHLHRPTLLWVPKALLNLLGKEKAQELLLNSASVVPKKLLEIDYPFLFPTLSSYMQQLL